MRAEQGLSEASSSASQRTISHDVSRRLDTTHSPVWNYKTLAAGDTKLAAPRPRGDDIPTGKTNSTRIPPRRLHHAGRTQEEHADAEEEDGSTPRSGLRRVALRHSISWRGVERSMEEGAFQPIPRFSRGVRDRSIYRDAEKDYQMVKFIIGRSYATGHWMTIASYIDTQGTGKRSARPGVQSAGLDADGPG